MAEKIICDKCSEMRGIEIGFETMEQFRAHLKTSGHEINANAWMYIKFPNME